MRWRTKRQWREPDLCGPERVAVILEKNVRWKFETPQERREREDDWHEVFAWWPKYDYRDGHAMWLEKCLRKRNHDSHTSRWWDYRPIALLPRDLGITEPVTDGSTYDGEIEGCAPPPKRAKKSAGKQPPIPRPLHRFTSADVS